MWCVWYMRCVCFCLCAFNEAHLKLSFCKQDLAKVNVCGYVCVCHTTYSLKPLLTYMRVNTTVLEYYQHTYANIIKYPMVA